MTTETTPQAAPEGLQSAGLALWQSVVKDFELNAGEIVRLEAACRLSDDLVRLQAELKDAPLVLESARGGLKAHPLIAEVRNHRAALARILVGLGLPEPDAAAKDDGSAKSAAGRRMAAIRWSGRSA